MLVNGPVNIVRLEGEIENRKKVLYVFFDIHSHIPYQTECDEIDAISLTKYITEEINTTPNKIAYDIFVEINQKDIGNIQLEYKAHYLYQVRKLISAKYKKDINVRYHYFDIRDLEFLVDIIDKFSISIPNFKNQFVFVSKQIYEIYKTFFKNKKNNKTASKIWTKYKHKNIKHILKKQLEFCEKLFEELLDLLVKIEKEYDEKILFGGPDKLKQEPYNIIDITGNIDRINLMSKLNIDIHNVRVIFNNAMLYLTDIYLLRRFLDKDYITNGLVYTGALHSADFIDILTNKFNFKITHTAKTFSDSENKYTNIVDIYNTFMGNRNDTYQCCDVSGLPRYFL